MIIENKSIFFLTRKQEVFNSAFRYSFFYHFDRGFFGAIKFSAGLT